MSRLTKTMLSNVLSPMHGEQPAGRAFGGALILHPVDGLSPDVAEVAVATPRPLRCPGVFHVEAAIKGQAMGCRMRSIHRGLSLLADHGRLGLAGKKHGVGVGVASSGDAEGDEADEGGHDKSSIDIPLPEEAGDGLIELEHQIVEAHLDDDDDDDDDADRSDVG